MAPRGTALERHRATVMSEDRRTRPGERAGASRSQGASIGHRLRRRARSGRSDRPRPARTGEFRGPVSPKGRPCRSPGGRRPRMRGAGNAPRKQQVDKHGPEQERHREQVEQLDQIGATRMVGYPLEPVNGFVVRSLREERRELEPGSQHQRCRGSQTANRSPPSGRACRRLWDLEDGGARAHAASIPQ